MGKEASTRMLRVGEELRHLLAAILRDYIPFPQKPREVSITITEVRMSPDLKHATVFVMPLASGQDTATIFASLTQNTKRINHLLAGKMSLRYLPRLRFVLDESLDKAHRIEQLLRDA